MFLLGHSCWSYLISKATGQKLNVNLPLYLALLSGVLPDFDIYFHPYLQHHTYTHSIVILGPVSILLTIRYKKLGAAFSSGLLSHLLTDSLVGDIPIAYPLSNYQIGLAQFIPSVAAIPSLFDTTLETGALLLVVVYVLRNGDYRQFTRPGRDSLRMAVTLASIVTLTLLFAGDNNISLTAFAFSRRALTLISLGHIFQAGALVLGTVQGLRAYLATGQGAAREQSSAE